MRLIIHETFIFDQHDYEHMKKYLMEVEKIEEKEILLHFYSIKNGGDSG